MFLQIISCVPVVKGKFPSGCVTGLPFQRYCVKVQYPCSTPIRLRCCTCSGPHVLARACRYACHESCLRLGAPAPCAAVRKGWQDVLAMCGQPLSGCSRALQLGLHEVRRPAAPASCAPDVPPSMLSSLHLRVLLSRREPASADLVVWLPCRRSFFGIACTACTAKQCTRIRAYSMIRR